MGVHPRPDWGRLVDHSPGRRTVAALVVIFVVLVTSLGAGGFVYERVQEESFRAQADRELESVATLQARYLTLWRSERESDARLVEHSIVLLNSLERSGGRSPALDALFRALKENGYSSAALVDAGGSVVASDGDTAELGARERTLLARTFATGRVAWDDFHSDSGGAQLSMAVPISSPGESARGALLVHMDPEAAVLPVLASWPVHRDTAESLLVRREGEEVVFLSSLRFAHVAPMAQRRPLSNRGLPAAMAVLGAERGAGDDYRGFHVLFAARPVGGSPWFVVSKVDETEVLAPARTRGYVAGGFALLLVAAAALAALLWWRMREAQIETSHRAAEIQAAMALRDSEERFRRGVLLAPIPIMIHAEDGSVVALSRAWVTVSGYTLTDVPTVSDWTERAYGKRQDQVKAYIDTLYQLNESVEEGEYEVVTRNGETRTWDFSSAPLGRMADGRRLVISMAKDVTERKRAEASLVAERERLAVTLRSIGDAVIATDTAARVLVMNRVAEELTGWSAKEATGSPLADVFHIVNEQSRRPCEDPVAKVLATGRVIGLANHTTLVSRNGRERSIADSGAPIQDAKGQTIGVVLVFRDVTEETLRDAALAKAQRMESLAVLAGGIAHDFNNMLTGVLVNLAIALEDTSSPSLPEVLTEARGAAQRTKALTQQLLTFSKGGAPVKRVADLKDVVRDTAIFCTRGWSGSCRLDVADDLWPARADPDQVAQVVQNIVINATEVMPRGGAVYIRAKNVILGAENEQLLSPGPYLRIGIVDEGPGIPGAIRDRIFEPFFSTKSRGSGLGLSVCHSIVAKHDGRIDVTSSVGSGAAFEIYLPAAPGAESMTELPNAADAMIHGRVLVMDDDESIRHATLKILAAVGCDTVTAPNGQEAVALYLDARKKGSPFDVVILDLTVSGGMGGAETLTQLKRVDPSISAIVSSGYSNDPIMASHLSFGFAAVLGKPYEPAQVREVVGRVIASRRAR